MNTTLIKSTNVFDLEKKVQDYLAQGYDLQGTLMTNDFSLIGQWMVQTEPNSEYKLVIAYDLIDLESSCQALMDEGWRFWYSDQRWGGRLLQWMERPRLVSRQPALFSKRVVVNAQAVTPENFHWLAGGARIPSILEG